MTLQITPKLCKQYQACKQGIEWMERYHKNGFTIDDVINKKVRVPSAFVAWAGHNLPFSDNDIKKYYEFLKIINSFKVSYSKDVVDSYDVNNSFFVRDSMYVIKSKYIVKSNSIYNSNDISDCHNVHNSIKVVQSKRVYNSEDINNSEFIFLSKKITKGYEVYDSGNIVNSKYLIKCENGENLFFSTNLKNCSNKIFCTELIDNDEFMIFNKVVTEKAFKMNKEILLEILDEYMHYAIFTHFKNEKYTMGLNEKSMILAFANIYVLDNKDLWNEIRSKILHYDEDLAYEITYISKVFKDVIGNE